MKPKGNHQRGYLPHRDYGSAVQAVTFREADSLPARVIQSWQAELQLHLDSPDETTRTATRQELLRRIAR